MNAIENEAQVMLENRTRKALMTCAELLVYCLKIGCEKSDLDELEKLWWRYHDDLGRLTSPNA